MATYISTQFSTAEEFENWIRMNEHANKDFLDNLCEADKAAWDNKACNIRVKDGKLQLLCANGNVLAEADYYAPDNTTVCCDENGAVKVKGIANANEPDGRNFRMWVGTWEEYRSIRIKDDKTLYLVSDDTTIDDIISAVNTLNDNFEAFKTALSNGNFVVFEATKAAKDGNGNVIVNTYMPKSGGDFSGTVRVPYFKVRNFNNFPSIVFQPSNSDENAGGIMCHEASTNRIMIVSAFHRDQDGAAERFGEYFRFPAPSARNTAAKWYNVLTSKNAVTIAQGGTGANTSAKARKNLDVPSTSELNDEIEKIKTGTTVAAKATNATNAAKVNDIEIKKNASGFLEFDSTKIPTLNGVPQKISDKKLSAAGYYIGHIVKKSNYNNLIPLPLFYYEHGCSHDLRMFGIDWDVMHHAYIENDGKLHITRLNAPTSTDTAIGKDVTEEFDLYLQRLS